MAFETRNPQTRGREAAARRFRAGRFTTGRTLIVRSLVWVVISSAFVVWNVHRMAQMHALGLPLRWWAYVQVGLWSIALGFWLWMGWRDLRRRDSNSV